NGNRRGRTSHPRLRATLSRNKGGLREPRSRRALPTFRLREARWGLGGHRMESGSRAPDEARARRRRAAVQVARGACVAGMGSMGGSNLRNHLRADRADLQSKNGTSVGSAEDALGFREAAVEERR